MPRLANVQLWYCLNKSKLKQKHKHLLNQIASQVPSFSSKRGQVTEKHVLTGSKHDMLGNQTFEVRQPLSKLLHQTWKTFDVFDDKQILLKLQTWNSSVQGFQKWSNSDGGYSTNKWNTWKVSYVPYVLTAVELQMFGYQACHVCAQLEHVFLSDVHA